MLYTWMLYISNATFQLPGFLSSHAFEDDEDEDDDDLPVNSCKDTYDASPADPTLTLGESETSTVTPSAIVSWRMWMVN